MNIRAVIFDIYNTLLEIGPPPADAAERWMKLCRAVRETGPGPDLAGFGAACERVIEREHARARQTGIPYPEIFWPAVAGEAWPDLARLAPERLGDFLSEHAALQRSVSLSPGASAVLRCLAESKVLLGLASNAQPYTLVELARALNGVNLRLELFHPRLRLLSFELGFSKPDPHVFRLLGARLCECQLQNDETLVVGDRLDNDIEPARKQGFSTWHLTAAAAPAGGDWQRLADHLRQVIS